MRILFICRANIGRSQMAAAFFNKLSKKHKASSAGTHVGLLKDGTPVHHFIVDCMKEIGYDVSKSTRRQLTAEMAEEADKIVVITDKKDLPDYIKDSQKVIFWNVEDAKDKPYGFHRLIRDKIKKLVEELVKELGYLAIIK